MIRVVACAAAILLAACASAPSASVADVEAVERARFAALTGADLAALESMLAEDLSYCHSNGRCDTKASFLASLRSGAMTYRQIDIEELEPRVFGTSAVINGTLAVKVAANGNPLQFRIRYTDVYVYDNGRWLLTAWQSTQIP